MKPDCYKCVYRRTILRSGHSRCVHPLVKTETDDALGQLIAILTSVGRINPMQAETEKLKIKANYHGIRMGWFQFPHNYDPLWLEGCEGYTLKEGEDDSTEVDR